MVEKDTFLDAVLPHVVFDGWSEAAMRAAAQELGVDMAAVRALFPRGPVDLALAYHDRGDAQMLERLCAAPKRFAATRSRCAQSAIRLRLRAASNMSPNQEAGKERRSAPRWIT